MAPLPSPSVTHQTAQAGSPGPYGPPLKLQAHPSQLPPTTLPRKGLSLRPKRQLLPPRGPSSCPNRLSREEWEEGGGTRGGSAHCSGESAQCSL